MPERKTIPRKCTGCGKVIERSNLVRIMRLHDTHEIVLMPDSRHFGRSSYLCCNKECLKITVKKKRLQKSLKKEVPLSVLQKLESIINK